MSPEERIAQLEVRVATLTDAVKDMDVTLTELRDLLIAAKGVRWVLATLIGLVAFGAGVAVKFLPFRP